METNEQKATINLAGLLPQRAGDTITLIEAIGILWSKKFFIAAFMVVGALIGCLVMNWIRPEFTSDAMLQIDIRGNKATRAMGEMGALLDMTSPADAEIELVKSRSVLAYVVEEEHLRFNAIPVGKMDRLLHREGRMDIDELDIPEIARRDRWTATVTGANSYAVITPEGAKLVEAEVGETVRAPYAGDTLVMRVRLIRAAVGQEFVLQQLKPLAAIRSLARKLSVSEKGKQTGILAVSLKHRYADRSATILNAIANTYVRHNVEKRSAEAEKTLEFLEKQLPGVKAKLDTAEKILADYRHKIGSVDMTGETQVHLQKEVDLQKQLLKLQQEYQEATRLFKDEHPAVRTIAKQQDKLKGELSKLKASAAKMPLTQQEVMRLQEDVQVNNAIYNTMLNNIQQLRVVRAGEVGNVRVVDYAMVEDRPSKPKKLNILICCVAASFMVAVLLVFLMRMLHNGVRSTTEVEKATSISVFAKIPERRGKVMKARRRNLVPLVVSQPEDPASEAFRSLLTSVDFTVPSQTHPVIMVSGLIPGVGKSFVSSNLAALHATSGKRTLLIDADMRRGVHRSSSKMGLAEVLGGLCEFGVAVATSDIENLFVISAGHTKLSPSELLRGENFRSMLDEARKQFDVIIVDTPPMSMVTDAELIYPAADFSLFVLHYGKHSMDEISEAMTKMKRFGEKPKAFVMNHCERETGRYGYGYGYGYYGYYSKKK
ncbi:MULTISPECIES: polysaccharide biosynthesis tyrosine autokinase [unclassified Fibrobacter]|uniref:polysaccharide biosynthesis tyrosine autokinase n=1 Tax=unclassified Fibrobacter TaxID=2634177 RepID=UPI000919F0F8|nr:MULTISPECIES: polysaccharide biosynthesis tyrosine autokinase [unclassified Fibrobacter]OWV06192.1 capsular biosynthesis protein [Fibrobacter sp. UWH3]SHK96114.1 tyrosine-protein kinase Etk/Wzc [Fibrobacter sp. UWH6]